MATPIINSRRAANTSTYTPIVFRDPPPDGTNIVNTAGMIRSLELVPGELDDLNRNATTDEAKRAARVIADLADAPSADRTLHAATELASIPRHTVIAALERVRGMRDNALAHATAVVNTPKTNGAQPAPAPTPATPAPAPSGATRLSSSIFAASRFRSAMSSAIAADVGTTASVMTFHPRSTPISSPIIGIGGAAPAPGSTPMSTMSGRTSAALVNRYDGVDLIALIPYVEPYLPPGTDLATLDPLDALQELDRKSGAVTVVIDALSRRNVQPLGVLHLEELDMTPLETQRGELVYSLPLAPKEKVTLSHKEWAVRESEFSEFVQDSIENYSERGVAETDEIAISSQTESRKTERTGMGSSGGVVMTGPADAGSTVVSNTQSQQASRKHATTVTSQASTRSTRDHKISFTVATVSGTEDFTSRLIENPHTNRTMRIDYFRRMKSWKVDLLRTGVRLAYDIVIPDPGRRLRVRQDLIRQYDKALAGSFNPGLSPGDMTKENWMQYAAAYGVALPAPPTDPETSTTFKQWQITVFSALRDAAYAKYSQVQESLRQRRADLARQIDSSADPDTLRQMEREEIVRLTLSWIVPGFPGTGTTIGEPQGLSDGSWQQALEFGEYIKFVHSAIDWGRLAYFLYPYFWGDRQVDRLFLRHADSTHREFLRAGAARVVVPIVPGFEDELTSFIDLGRIGKLPNGHRFGEVISAVRQANTAFTATVANDQTVTLKKTLIGTWTEYTPTGALDIEAVTTPVVEL